MKRVLCTVAVLLVAVSAFAGTAAKMDDMTPQQAWSALTNCPVCSAWMQDPALGPTIQHSIFATKTGYVETMSTADAAMVPSFMKADAECQTRAASIGSMAAEEKAKLCPICSGMMKFMGRSDVTMENFKTDMGVITVASSNTAEGLKALHDYAAMNEAFSQKLSKAGEMMSKDPAKAKM